MNNTHKIKLTDIYFATNFHFLDLQLLLSLLRRCWLCDQTCSLFDTQSGQTG